jgi:ComEC/Rec2-related protein
VIRLRLITLVAVAVVAGALSAAVTRNSAVWTFIALGALGIAYALQTRHPCRNLIRVVIALSLFWPLYTIQKKIMLDLAPDQLQAGTTVIAGTVRTSSLVQSSSGTMFEMSAVMADDGLLAHSVMIQVHLPDRRTGPTFGQYVRVSGMASSARPALNPGEEPHGPPSPQLFLANDVQAVFSRSLASTWGRWTARARDFVERRARGLMTYRAYGLLEELLLHRRLFSTVDRHLFSETGTSHLLAISGLHLSLVFAMMTILLGSAFSDKSFGRTLVPLLATLVYLAFIDFPLSADRAFVMLCIVALTRLLGGHTSKLASLSWAALALTLVDPASVFDIGLQLSFASIAGLFFIGEPLSHHIHVGKGPVRTLLASLCATVGASLPAAALAIPTFHVLAPVALLANIVAIPAVSLLLPILLAWSALLLVVPLLAALLTPVINLAAVILFGCLEFFARLPGSHVNVAVPASMTLLSLGILFAVIALTVDNRARLRSWHHANIPIVTALALVLVTFAVGISPSDTRVTFPVVEQGNVVLVRDRDLGTWLCLCDTDAKSAERAIRAVAVLGINTVDAVVFSGKPPDLPEQLDALFTTLSPRHVWIPSECVTGPVPGLDDRFQATIQLLAPNQMVGLSHGSSLIRVGRADTSGPVISLTAGALSGIAGSSAVNPIHVPGFAYDTSSGVVNIATPETASRITLGQAGCITVFMRGSRCWVASNLRR